MRIRNSVYSFLVPCQLLISVPANVSLLILDIEYRLMTAFSFLVLPWA